MDRRHIKQLEQFHTRALRMIMGIRWQDRVTNQDVLDRAGSTSMESMLLKAQLRWTGHAIRMSNSRTPRQLLYGELMCGSCKQGRPKLRFKDTLKSELKWSGTRHVNLTLLLQKDPSPHEQQLPLKRTGVSVSLLQETDITGLCPLQPEQQTIVSTPFGACVLPALD